MFFLMLRRRPAPKRPGTLCHTTPLCRSREIEIVHRPRRRRLVEPAEVQFRAQPETASEERRDKQVRCQDEKRDPKLGREISACVEHAMPDTENRQMSADRSQKKCNGEDKCGDHL